MRNFLLTTFFLIVIFLTTSLKAQTCKTPENLSVSNLSTTSATLLWDLSATGDVPSSYFFRMSTSSSTIVATDSNLVAMQQSHTLTNLTANTTYVVELSSTCNTTGSGTSEMVTYTFTTPCVSQSAPYSEDFNTTYPACIFAGNAEWTNGGRTGKCMTLTTTASQSAYLVFPSLNIASDTIQATLWMKSSSVIGGNVPVQIGIVTDPADIAGSFEPLYIGQLSTTTWTEVRMNTSATIAPVTQTTMIAVVIPQGLDRTVFVDDAEIRTIPTCIRPEDFAITNVTSTSATFSWTTTNAQMVRIYLNSATDTRAVAATSNPYTITTLQPNTEYTFQIRAICSATDSSEMNLTTLTAHTECVTADSAIFLQTFESLTVPNALPDCWKEGWWTKPAGNNKVYPFAATTDHAHNGTRSMAFLQQTDGTVAYLSSQALPIDQAGRYTLSVWVYRQNASSAQSEGLKFWVSPHPDDTTGATLLGYIPRHYLATPVEHTANQWYNYEFVINTTGTHYILVEGMSENAAPVLFDDIAVRLTPSCFHVTNLLFSAPTHNSIGMTWTPGANEQQWIVSYSLNDGAYVTDTVSSPAFTIPNLNPATAYTLDGTVTSLCAPGDLSDPVSFTNTFVTTCLPLTFLPYSCGFETEELVQMSNPLPYCWSRYNDATGSDNTHPQASVSSTYSHSGTGYLKFLPVTTVTDYGEHQIAILPDLNTTLYPINTLRLVFYAQATTINPVPTITVGVMTDPTDLATFTATDSFTIGTTEYLRYEARFASYTGTGSYIAMMVRREETAFLSVNVDDIRLEPVPACADIDGAGVSVTDITDRTATLTVTDLTATSWSYAYGVAGTPLSACTLVDSVAGTSVILGNLSPQTSYVVYARRRCGSQYGSWSSAVTFRTACVPFNVPFSDNFETYTLTELTGCYEVVADDVYLNVFADGTSTTGTFNHSSGGSKGLSTSFYASSPSQAPTSGEVTVSTLVYLEAGRNYEISAYAHKPQTGNNYTLAILCGETSTSLTPVATVTVNQTTWTRHKGYFTPVTTGGYHIAFRTSATGAGLEYNLYIDDISVNEISCVPPTDAFVSRLTSASATIGITSAGTALDVAVSTSPITVPGTVIGNVFRDTITTDSVTVTNLAVNTTYYYTVRSICNGTEASEWLTPRTFHTRCLTANVPYSEGFESTSAVSCWQPLSGDGSITRTTTIRNTGSSSMKATSVSAVSPEFDVTTFAPYMLTGWAYSTTDSAVLTIGVMNDPDDASSFEIISSVVISPANTWVEFASYFNLLNDPDYADFYNARYLLLATGNNTIYFDDLNLDYTPTCNRPTQGIVSSISGNSVTVDWTENGTATQWRLYAVNTYGIEVAQVVTAHPYTLTGIAPATHYSLYVRSICSATDTSSAYKIGEFTTACATITPPYSENFETYTTGIYPQCWDISLSDHTTTYNNHPDYIWAVYSQAGNKSIRLYNQGSQSGDMIIVSPEVALPTGHNYDFRYDYCHQASSGTLAVGIRRRGQTTFTTLATHQNNGTTDATTPSAFLMGSCNLQSYVGDTVQFMFMNHTNWGTGSIWIDNVRVRELSDCSEITALSVQDVTSQSIMIAFADTAGHNTWQYAVVPTGHDVTEATPVTITSKIFTITALAQSTSYDIYVRAVCSATDFSTWNTITQKTLALPAALPYITDFSNTTQNNDWKRIGGGVNDFVFGNDGNATFATGSHALYVSSNGATYTYDVNVSSLSGIARLFSFGETIYNFEFDWKCTGGENISDFGRFYLAPASSDLLPTYTSPMLFRNFVWPDNIIALDGGNPVNLTEDIQHLSQMIDMTGRSGEYYLVFLWANDGSAGIVNYPLSVGNLAVSELTCDPVVNLTVDESSISLHSATATFNNPNPGADIRWVVSTSALITDSVMSGVTQAETITLTGLSHSTIYHLFVRSECNAADRSPWTTVSFRTACGAVSSFPLFESFEGTLFPPVCWTNTSLTSVVDAIGTIYGLWEQATRNTHTGTKSATITTSPGLSALLATPALQLEADREYHVSFWLMQSGSSWNNDEMNLYVGPSATTTAGATQLAHYVIYDSNHSGNSLVQFDVDLPSGLSGEYYVLFEGIDVTNGYIYLDDITVDVYPPCRNLTTLPQVVATTSTTATVTMPMGMRSSMKFGIAPYSASPQPSQITAYQSTTTGTVTFTGLTPNAAYSVFVRGYCADGDSTSWTTAVTLQTKINDCFNPENLHVVGTVTDNAVTIAWNTVPDVTSYQCVRSSAYSADTVVVTTPQVSYSGLTPNCDYNFIVRGFCGAVDTTGWSTFAFRTLTRPATLPYVTGFEPNDSNQLWQRHASGYANNFVIGADAQAHTSGTRGLYISSDGRSYSQSMPTNATPQYGVNIYGVTYYTRTIYFPAAGNYEVAFDWKCDPVSGGLSYEAYGRAFVAPATATLPVDDDEYLRDLPEGSFAICSNLEGSPTWQRASSIFTIDAPQYMNLVFMYISVNVNGYADPDDMSDTPLAIDNVSVSQVSCLPVASLTPLSVTDTSAVVLINHPDPVTIEYSLLTSYSLDSLNVMTLATTSLRDTLRLTGLTPLTEYYLIARQRCTQADSSSWRMLSFSTTAVPAPLPYICDFEDATENANWLYTHAQPNYFTIGTSTSYGGTHSLYVTDDGSSYNYNDTALSFAYAHRIISLPAGLYEYSYDWQCNGQANDDGARIFLLPADALLFTNSWLYGLSYTTVPRNAIALDNGFLYGRTSYATNTGSFTVPEDKLYNIVVAWRNGTDGGANPPISVDNISINAVTCLPPTVTMVAGSIGENTASVAISNVNAGSSLVYALSTSASLSDVLYYDTLAYAAQDTIILASLSASSSYYLHVRALCSADDESYWSSVQFSTLCGEITIYPYSESFEHLSATNGYVANALSPICWSSINAVSAKPCYNITTSQHAVGSQSLRLTSSATVPLYILLPEMDDLNSRYLTFRSMYSATSSAAGTLSVGYLTDPDDGDTFVSLLDVSRTTSWTAQSLIYSSIPAGARMAFRYQGAATTSYYAYIDNVRVSRLVNGPVYYDTICNNANYIMHGFAISKSKISLGANTFTRVSQNTTEGSVDTLVTAHVYRLDNIITVTSDTICGGEPYTRGLWNIANPVTRAYTQTFRGASACGCDSSVRLNLTVIPVSFVITDTICNGGSYTFRDTVITDPGKYTRSYLNTFGCTCTDTLYLMVLPDSVFDVATVCQNNLPYRWRGQDISTAGSHTLSVTGPRGCSQIAVLDLTILSTDSTINASFCQGGSVQVVDTVINSAGNYVIQRIDPLGGCFITYHITATVNPVVPVDVYDFACEGYPYTGNGITNLPVTSDTVVIVRNKTVDASCDSLTNVHIRYIPTVYKDLYVTIAEGESYRFNGSDLTKAGVYTATFRTVITNCDSVVTLNLTVLSAVDNVSDITIDLVPNPVNAGQTTFVYGDIAQIAKVEILNSFGQIVETFTPQTEPIELPRITVTGVYYIRLTTTSGKTHLQKLIVK